MSRYLNSIDRDGCFFLFLGILVVCFAIFVIYDHWTGTQEIKVRQLVDKRYVPEHQSVHWDTHANTMVTDTYPEKFIMVLEFDNLIREIYVCKMDYNAYRTGEKIFCHVTIGGVSRSAYLRGITKWQNPEIN